MPVPASASPTVSSPAVSSPAARLRVLVSRTDRLGDVALSLPLCGLLRERLGATVVFLGRRYVRPVLEACDAVDEIVEWDEAADASPAAARALLRGARADAVLHLFPRPAIAWAALGARIPRRIGTSRRWYHWPTCTDRVALARRDSPLHEAQLDVLLARPLLGAACVEAVAAAPPPALARYAALTPRVPVPATVPPLLAPDRFVLALHPRSSGSAREWPLASYRALVDALPPARFRVLVTGSAAEGAAMRGWLDTLPAHAHDLTGALSLAELIAVLAAAGGLVAASTGPLHLAALAGTRALGLFSPVRPIHPGRWAPIGPRAEVLVAPAGGEAPGGELAGIEAGAVLGRVLAWAGA